MAINSTKLNSTMIISYKTGVDEDGKDVIKQQKYSGIKVDASDEDIYGVADSFNQVLEYNIQSVARDDKEELTEV
ncbi:MAG: DUF1659 domain-containing protein [Clostridiaceae bacterium]